MVYQKFNLKNGNISLRVNTVFLHLLEFLPNDHFDVMFYLYMSIPMSLTYFLSHLFHSLLFLMTRIGKQHLIGFALEHTQLAAHLLLILPRHNFELCCSLCFCRPTSSHSSNRRKTLTQQLHYKATGQNIVSTTFLLQTVSGSGDG